MELGGAGLTTTLLIVGPSIGLTVRNLSNSCSLNNLIICVLMSFTSGSEAFPVIKFLKDLRSLKCDLIPYNFHRTKPIMTSQSTTVMI